MTRTGSASTLSRRRAGHFLRRVVLDAPTEGDGRYPFNLPLVRAIQAAGGFELHPGVTAIVGENGSGKSTLIEAIAVALGLNPEGGSRSLQFSTRATESELGTYARAVRAPGRERRSFFLRAESLITATIRTASEGPPPGRVHAGSDPAKAVGHR